MFLRGAVHLASAALPEHERSLHIVERTAHKLARMPCAYAHPFSQALLAGVAARRGARDHAVSLLVEAEAEFRRLGMRAHVAMVQWRRGELLGRAEGAQLIAEADAVFAREGVRNPERMVQMLLPGRWS
jgi:hypothetical protein